MKIFLTILQIKTNMNGSCLQKTMKDDDGYNNSDKMVKRHATKTSLVFVIFLSLRVKIPNWIQNIESELANDVKLLGFSF